MSGTEGRKWRSAEVVATIIGLATVVVAVIAVLLDHSPFGGSSEAAPTTSPPLVTSRPPVPGPPTQGGSTTTAASPSRYLTDLAPDSGGGNVQRVGAHSLRMNCGSGESVDPTRDVTYVVPSAVTYRSFASGFSAAGMSDTRIQVVLLIDHQQVAAPVVATGSSTRLSWSGERAGQLTLRIICDPGATAATFTDPGLSG